MKSLKFGIILLGTVGLTFLAACGSGEQSSNSTGKTTASQGETAAKTSPAPAKETAAKTAHPSKSQGGQVIESGPYHLEFLTEPEAEGIHIDFYLQKGDNHEPIPNAKVTAQVQLPDGTQKSLNLTYDAEGKHYAVLLPEKAPGEYKVAVLSDINGEKVNGRFSFKK